MSTQGQSTPPSSRQALLRPRLLSQTQARFTRRITGVVAGAGFGKSTLLSQSVAENRLSPRGVDLWLSCTSDHQAPSCLVADLTAAAGVDTRRAPDDAAFAADQLVELILSFAPRQVSLVLDDLHALDEQSPGRRCLALLLEQLPGNGHLLVASRTPLLLGLTRLIPTGDGLLLTEADLAFQDDELRTFALARGVEPELLSGLSGWPALAELVAVTGNSSVRDYVWEEVLATRSPAQRRVLAILAHLGAADDDVISHVLAEPVDLVAALDGVPLVSVTDDGWWSLHRLMAAAVTTRESVAVETLDRGAQALRRAGRYRQAMHLVRARNQWSELDDLVVEVCAGLTPLVPAELLREWHRLLPDERRELAAGRLLLGTALKEADPWRSRSELESAATQFRAEEHVEGELAATLGLFHLHFWLGEIDQLRMVLARWAQLAADEVAEAGVRNQLGRAMLASTPSMAEHELSLLPRRITGTSAPLAAWVRSNLLVMTLGEPERAQSWGVEALSMAPATLRGSVRCDLLEAYRITGDLPAAFEQAEALDSEEVSLVTARQLSAVVILRAVAGQLDACRPLVQELRRLAETARLPWSQLGLSIAEAMVAASRGDDPTAAASMSRWDNTPLARPIVLLRLSLAALPLQYVLRPSTREVWEATELAGVLEGHRRLARAVVALRENASLEPLTVLSDEDLEHAAAILPLPWAAHLGVGLAYRGRASGVALVQQLGPGARPALRDVEDRGGLLAKTARRLLASVPSAPRHRVRIDVLGPLELAHDDVPIDDATARRERVRQLIAFLVVNRQVPRHVAAAALWPDLEEADAARNLRVTLNYVQKVLEPDRDERDAPFFVRAHGTMLEVTEDPALQVDLWAFEEELADAEAAERAGLPSQALPGYLAAIERYRGDLLADLPPAPWSMHDRDRLRTHFVAACVRAGNLLAAKGEHARAERLANRALAIEEWSEPAYQLLVTTLLARGDRAGARRALDRCFDMLTDLGVEGARETFDLESALRHGVR